MQAGVVAAVQGAPPKSAAVSAEATDRATCLYETEWQIASAAMRPYQQLTPSRPAQRHIMPHWQSVKAADFMWASAEKFEKPYMVCSYSALQMFQALLLCFARVFVSANSNTDISIVANKCDCSHIYSTCQTSVCSPSKAKSRRAIA